MKKIYIFLSIITLLLTLSSCVEVSHLIVFGKYSVKTIEDDFDGYKKYQLESNPLLAKEPNLEINEMARPIAVSGTHLLVQRFEKEQHISYSIILERTNSSWLFISESAPINILFTDQEGKDNKMKLYPESKRFTNVLDNGTVHERILYNITFDQLKRLATGVSGKVKIMGQDSYEVKYIYYVNFGYIKLFVDEKFNKV